MEKDIVKMLMGIHVHQIVHLKSAHFASIVRVVGWCPRLLNFEPILAAEVGGAFIGAVQQSDTCGEGSVVKD